MVKAKIIDMKNLYVKLMSLLIVCTAHGDSDSELKQVVLCSTPVTINCNDEESFIDMSALDTRRGIAKYSDTVTSSSCPVDYDTALSVSCAGASYHLGPQHTCHGMRACTLDPGWVGLNIRADRCSQVQTSETYIRANLMLIRYRCFNLKNIKNWAMMSSHGSGIETQKLEFSGISTGHIFGPGFPDPTPPEPQYTYCTVKSGGPADLDIALKSLNLMGEVEEQCQERLEFHIDGKSHKFFCNPQKNFLYNAPKPFRISMQNTLVIAFTKCSSEQGGKIWIHVTANRNIVTTCHDRSLKPSQEHCDASVYQNNTQFVSIDKKDDQLEKTEDEIDHEKVIIIVGCVCAVIVVGVLVALVCFVQRKRRMREQKHNATNENTYENAAPTYDEIDEIKKTTAPEEGVKRHEYSEIIPENLNSYDRLNLDRCKK